MGLYIATPRDSAEKIKGDLLESLAEKLLSAQNYTIKNRNIRRAGMEIDLECQHTVISSKKIYVECKAYQEEKNIQSGIIKNLFATRSVEEYDEAWLITSSNLGSDAKGFVEKIQSGSDGNKFAFYTSEKVITALQDAGVIVQKQKFISEIEKLNSASNKIGLTHLLVCTYGIFWITEHLKGGVPDGFITGHAESGDFVLESELIDNLSTLEFKYSNYNFGVIYKLLDPTDKTLEGRRLKGAALRTDYIAKIISESDVPPTSVKGKKATIDDLFVYPDLEKIDVSKSTGASNPISSEAMLNKLHDASCLILGSDMSGKTTLSYIFQRRQQHPSNISIRLDPTSLKNFKKTTIDKAVLKAFIDQYDVVGIPNATIESYIEDSRSNIVLLIDDFDKVSSKNTTSLISTAKQIINNYHRVIIFANSSKELEFTTSNEGQETFGNFEIYRLLQLGHLKRDELIENWITVNSEDRLDRANMLAKKDDFANRINVAIGTNYLPTYPFYSLAILEMLESGSKAQLQGSEYAALYGHLVNHALILNKIKVTDLGFYNTYLSHLAHKLHESKNTSINNSDLESFFNEYLSIMGLKKSFSLIHRKLIDSRILRFDNNKYSFNLPYYRYYFFAKYLSDNIETRSVKETIQTLVDSLHEDDSANTVVFLVYHSKNSEIIDFIINKAKSQFESIQPQTLSGNEVENINALITEDVSFILRNGSATEHRKKRLKRQDSYERQEAHKEESTHDNILDIYGQITAAFRTIDVLGKITSNYYGELKADRKNLIIQELYELGFRSLRTFLGSFESYTGALRSHIETKIEGKNITTYEDKRKAANQIIYSFTHIITYSFIKRVSDSVISPDLMLTIEDVLADKDVPAAKLTAIATKLNFPGGLEKNSDEIAKLYGELSTNSLARDLLRFLTIEHIYKFEVGYKEKQSICNQLGISFAAVQRKRLKSNESKKK